MGRAGEEGTRNGRTVLNMSLKGRARKLGLGEKTESLAYRIEQLNSDGEV